MHAFRISLLVSALSCVSTGCPGGGDAPSATGTDPRRTLAVESRQLTGKLEALVSAPDAEAEEAAAQQLLLWLRGSRPWRTEGYRLEVRAAVDGPALDAAALARRRSEAPDQPLWVRCPDFEPAPEVRWIPRSPASVERLRPVLAAGEAAPEEAADAQ